MSDLGPLIDLGFENKKSSLASTFGAIFLGPRRVSSRAILSQQPFAVSMRSRACRAYQIVPRCNRARACSSKIRGKAKFPP